jgi:hypothetical protein
LIFRIVSRECGAEHRSSGMKRLNTTTATVLPTIPSQSMVHTDSMVCPEEPFRARLVPGESSANRKLKI